MPLPLNLVNYNDTGTQKSTELGEQKRKFRRAVGGAVLAFMCWRRNAANLILGGIPFASIETGACDEPRTKYGLDPASIDRFIALGWRSA